MFDFDDANMGLVLLYRYCRGRVSDDAGEVEEDEDDADGGDVAHAEEHIGLRPSLEASAVGELFVNDLAVHNPSHIQRREDATDEHEDVAGGIVHHVEDVLAPQLDVVQHIERQSCQNRKGKGKQCRPCDGAGT